MTKPKLRLRPTAIDERTVDNIVGLLAHQRGIPRADAARDLLAGLAAWFGIDFGRERTSHEGPAACRTSSRLSSKAYVSPSRPARLP